MMIALIAIIALASALGANASCPSNAPICAKVVSANTGYNYTYYYCAGAVDCTASAAGIKCPVAGTGPFSDSSCSVAYTYSPPPSTMVSSPSPPSMMVSSPPPSMMTSSPSPSMMISSPPPPVVPSITCNQFVNIQTPQTNQSSFGPYRPSTVNYTICYSSTLLQYGSYNNGVQTVTYNLYTADLGGFPYVPGVNITQNNTVPTITTQAQCNTFLGNILSNVTANCANFCKYSGCKCSYQYLCCTSSNCNIPLYFTSGAGKIAISVVLMAVSLVAAVSVGLF